MGPLFHRNLRLGNNVQHVIRPGMHHVEREMIFLEIQLVPGTARVIVVPVVQNLRIFVFTSGINPEVEAERLRALVVADILSKKPAVGICKEQSVAFGSAGTDTTFFKNRWGNTWHSCK